MPVPPAGNTANQQLRLDTLLSTAVHPHLLAAIYTNRAVTQPIVELTALQYLCSFSKYRLFPLRLS